MSAKTARLVLGLSAAAMLLPALPSSSSAGPAYGSEPFQTQPMGPLSRPNGLLDAPRGPAFGGGPCGLDCVCPPRHSDPRCVDSYPYAGLNSDDPFDDEIGIERRHHFDLHDRMGDHDPDHDHDRRGPDGGSTYQHHGGFGGWVGGMPLLPTAMAAAAIRAGKGAQRRRITTICTA
jgi:hypothetical protein